MHEFLHVTHAILRIVIESQQCGPQHRAPCLTLSVVDAANSLLYAINRFVVTQTEVTSFTHAALRLNCTAVN